MDDLGQLMRTTGDEKNVVLLKFFKDLSVGPLWDESRSRVSHDGFPIVGKVSDLELYGG